MYKRQWTAAGCALLAPALYALSAPLSKLLLGKLPETLMASLLYLGAGLGMAAVARSKVGRRPGNRSAWTGRSAPMSSG
jgi:hypothetical protein